MSDLVSRSNCLQLFGVACAAPAALAQPAVWPSRPIKLVAGGPGSVTDVRARWLAERLASALGQPVIVENNGAAGGNLGAALVARAAPDGYTLLFTHQGLAAINPHIYANPGYDPIRDFAPVSRFGVGPLLLVVPVTSSIVSVADLVAKAKSQPNSLNFGTPGNGFPPHLAAELFMRLAGFRATHVPYRGGGAMMSALLAAEVDWSIEGLTTTLPQVRGGRLRALAVTGGRRSALLPDTPTLSEAGVKGYEFVGWTGVAAPAATPSSVLDRLNHEIDRISGSDEGRRWFGGIGAEAGQLSRSEFASFIREEHAKLGDVIRTVGIRAE